MLIRRPPRPLQCDAQSLDELRELIREMWQRVRRIEDELAGRKLDRDDEDEV
jgi:hypothetical protein